MSVIYDGKEYVAKREDNLSTLDLSGMGIKKISDIKGLETLTGLEVLNLNNNQISEIENLENLTNLEDLQLEKNLIEIIKGFDNLVNLRVLNLYKNNISEVENFGNMGNLRVIFLGGNPIYRTLVNTVGWVTPQTIEQYSKMLPEERVDAKKRIQRIERGGFSTVRIQELGYLFLFYLIGGILAIIGALSYSSVIGYGLMVLGMLFMGISTLIFLSRLKRS
jgi:hypothetical protein